MSNKVITIDLERYNDLIKSEEVLKEIYSYKTVGYWTKDGRQLQIEFEKVDNKNFAKGWQKGTITLVTKILFAQIRALLNGHNFSLKFSKKGKQIRSEAQKTLTKLSLTPLEKKLYEFCKRKKIDLTKSIGEIHYEVEAMRFKNLKGQRVLSRSTVGKMKNKIKKICT